MALIGHEPTLILLDELPPWLDNAQTIAIGQGTLANVATYALANLLSAASKLPRTMVVVSNLSAAYQGASKSLAQILSNLEQEVRRGAKEITPVALNSNEIFEILRRRLFEALPDRAHIDRVADAYAKAMDEAVRSRMVGKTPEQFADEIHRCYPPPPSTRWPRMPGTCIAARTMPCTSPPRRTSPSGSRARPRRRRKTRSSRASPTG